jgi:glyoxylase-like metal-dependent hydrolase (beta-lactamase superfamily II)
MVNDDSTISPGELKKRLDEGSVPFILDLRYEDEFQAWRIEGRYDFETVNICKIDFVGEEEQYFDRLPKDKPILLICAHGDSSGYEAKVLQKNGFDAVSLKGGMDAWSEYYETNKINGSPDIYQIHRVAKGCLTYLVVSDSSAVVIDAARHIEQVTDLADSLGANIEGVIETHLQADHISGGPMLAEKTGSAYYLHPKDAKDVTFHYSMLESGQSIKFGKSRLDILESPGHTPGSSSILLDGRFLFTGDTIMKEAIGRPDLGGKVKEWAALLYGTLFERFAHLDDNIVILPTHAASIKEQDKGGGIHFTLGNARKEKDLFQIRNIDEFTAYVEKSLPDNPDRYEDIRKVNAGLLDPDEDKRKELEIGKNLCGIEKIH